MHISGNVRTFPLIRTALLAMLGLAGAFKGKNPMKNRKSILCVLGFVLTFMVAATAADAPRLTFRFTTIEVPGAAQTLPRGVNQTGVIVGSYVDHRAVNHGFMLKGNTVTTIDDPKGTDSFCHNISFPGALAIVGSYTNSSGKAVGFLYKNRQFTDVPGPAGATGSFALGLNDSGEIVGSYLDAGGATHGFLLKGGAYKTLDVPGATATTATEINKNGFIVLYWTDSKGVEKSSLYNGSTYKTIDVPGATGSLVFGLSNNQDVVYEWIDAKNRRHGALLTNGAYYKFDFPRSFQTYGSGINDHQLIVGAYQAARGGPFQGFKATYK